MKKTLRVILFIQLIYGTVIGFLNPTFSRWMSVGEYPLSEIGIVSASMSAGIFVGSCTPVLSSWIERRWGVKIRLLEHLGVYAGLLVFVTVGYVYVFLLNPSWGFPALIILRLVNGFVNMNLYVLTLDYFNQASWSLTQRAVEHKSRMAKRTILYVWTSAAATGVSTLLLSYPQVWWVVAVFITVLLAGMAWIPIAPPASAPEQPKSTSIPRRRQWTSSRPRRFLLAIGGLESPKSIADSVFIAFIPVYNELAIVLIVQAIAGRIGMSIGSWFGAKISKAWNRVAIQGSYLLFGAAAIVLWSSNSPWAIMFGVLMAWAAANISGIITNQWAMSLVQEQDHDRVVRVPEMIGNLTRVSAILILSWVASVTSLSWMWLVLGIFPIISSIILYRMEEFRWDQKGYRDIRLKPLTQNLLKRGKAFLLGVFLLLLTLQ